MVSKIQTSAIYSDLVLIVEKIIGRIISKPQFSKLWTDTITSDVYQRFNLKVTKEYRFSDDEIFPSYLKLKKAMQDNRSLDFFFQHFAEKIVRYANLDEASVEEHKKLIIEMLSNYIVTKNGSIFTINDPFVLRDSASIVEFEERIFNEYGVQMRDIFNGPMPWFYTATQHSFAYVIEGILLHADIMKKEKDECAADTVKVKAILIGADHKDTFVRQRDMLKTLPYEPLGEFLGETISDAGKVGYEIKNMTIVITIQANDEDE